MLAGLLNPWTLRAALLAAACASAVALYGRAYDAGAADAEARAAAERAALETRLAARTSALRATTEDLARVRAARAETIERVEDDANTAPDADRRALTPDGVQRLRERWGASE